MITNLQSQDVHGQSSILSDGQLSTSSIDESSTSSQSTIRPLLQSHLSVSTTGAVSLYTSDDKVYICVILHDAFNLL